MRGLRPTLVFAGLTVAIWATRLRNLSSESDATAVDVGVASAMAGLGVAAGVGAVAAIRSGDRSETLVRIVGTLAVATVAVWVIRSAAIWLADWSIAFKVIHTALAVVSIGVGRWAWRRLSADAERPVPASS